MGLRSYLRDGWRQGMLEGAIQYGRKLLREDKDEEFLAFCQKAAGRFPRSAEIHYMLSTALRIDERSDEEVAAQAAKAAAIGARDPNMQVRAGYRLIDADDVEAARMCVARAEESADGHFGLAVDLDGLKGRIAAREGDFVEAEELFRSVLRREPQWPGNCNQLARFLWARGRNEEALTVLAELLSRLREERDNSPGRRKDVEGAERLQGQIASETHAEPTE
jgi:tetratricopeptide (TPR) repeat protein